MTKPLTPAGCDAVIVYWVDQLNQHTRAANHAVEQLNLLFEQIKQHPTTQAVVPELPK